MSPRTPQAGFDAATDPLTDEEVVRRVLAGETALFEVLVRRHDQRLYRVARAILRSEADAEDVVQEAHVAAWRALSRFEGRSSYATWLTRIAVHEAWRRARRSSRLVALPDDGEPPSEQASRERGAPAGLRPAGGGPAPPAGPDEQAALREAVGLVERALDELPDGSREVFVLRDVQQLTTHETAECLGISEAAVKVRLHRARGRMRDALDRRLDPAAREVLPFLGHRCERVTREVMARIAGTKPG